MAETKTITGVDVATVFVMEQQGEKKVPIAVGIPRGQKLPENLREGELERLEKLGVFEDKTHAQRVRENQTVARARAAASTAEAAAAAAGLNPGAAAREQIAANTNFDGLKVDDAIEFIESLPETEREPYFEAERAKGRKGVLEHFDQPTE